VSAACSFQILTEVVVHTLVVIAFLFALKAPAALQRRLFKGDDLKEAFRSRATLMFASTWVITLMVLLWLILQLVMFPFGMFECLPDFRWLNP
jgi:hypothetical protein